MRGGWYKLYGFVAVEYLLSGILDYRTLLEVVYGLFQNCTQVMEVIYAPLFVRPRADKNVV